jgi:hypothetical protein
MTPWRENAVRLVSNYKALPPGWLVARSISWVRPGLVTTLDRKGKC